MQDKHKIIERVAGFIERFVYFKDPCLYQLVALWVLMTHLLEEKFDDAAYLCVHSADPGSGKTRLLEVLEQLVKNPALHVSPTEAVLFRTAEGTTQLLDEGDGWQDGGEGIRSVLNAGNRRGGTVTRLRGENRTYRPETFPVFAPRAIAGLNLTRSLNRTILDRSYTIQMVPRPIEKKLEKFRLRKLSVEIETLQKEIASWVEEHKAELGRAYDKGDFPYLEDFRDRTQDVSEPLAAILEVALKGRQELEDARLSLMDAICLTRPIEGGISKKAHILRAIHQTMKDRKMDSLTGNATELLAACPSLPEGTTEYDIARTLRDNNLRTKSVRANGEPRYRYIVTREEIEALVSRYEE